ncbi:hypothetical protein OIC43_09465 [Streptomyces sp. NBC_00825]|nr:hypothetical protein OG832_34230 [Streptomyces sp. NBC_00826]WTH95493.1 hypothetical protein OIC43_09465 [Streptomyces sp. NBC_00825]WTI04223.1 hypothetical protein OHA23_09450 [Streptomyces sp. NBC_00822]
MHLDGGPESKLPLLLAAFQYRFGRDLDAMTQHLVDDVAVGWEELGSDLLDGALPETVTALTWGDRWPSRTMDTLMTLDGSPPTRMTVTETTAADQDMAWGYVLRPQGLEVIPVQYAPSGTVFNWDSDPCTDFSDPTAWNTVAFPQPSPAPGARHTSPPKEAPCGPHRARPIGHVR